MKNHEIMKKFFIAVLAVLSSASALAQDVITYYHTDAAGSPIAATDANGDLAWREDYSPYGERLQKQVAANDDHMWFTGHHHDEQSGLTYAGARHYDPMIGRFMGVDPAAMDSANQFTFNRYAYANNNPHSFKDPSGETTVPIVVVGSGILAGAGCAASASCRDAFAKVDWHKITAPVLWEAVLGSRVREDSTQGLEGLDSRDKVFSKQEPPAGSEPISETPWSGDHGDIKDAIGAGPKDSVKVSPNGDVWAQNPDGSWTNHGDAGILTGSGRPSGEKGKDRDSDRENQRKRGREKRGWSDRERR